MSPRHRVIAVAMVILALGVCAAFPFYRGTDSEPAESEAADAPGQLAWQTPDERASRSPTDVDATPRPAVPPQLPPHEGPRAVPGGSPVPQLPDAFPSGPRGPASDRTARAGPDLSRSTSPRADVPPLWNRTVAGGTTHPRPHAPLVPFGRSDSPAARETGTESADSEWREHRVVDGDSLPSLARRYLGDAGYAPQIFQANRHQLEHAELLPLGMVLRTPPPASSGPTDAGVPATADGGASRAPVHPGPPLVPLHR